MSDPTRKTGKKSSRLSVPKTIQFWLKALTAQNYTNCQNYCRLQQEYCQNSFEALRLNSFTIFSGFQSGKMFFRR